VTNLSTIISSHPEAEEGFKGSASPIKVERELGLERCKTVWSLSAFAV